jgi:manganese/iron transport system permease protein
MMELLQESFFRNALLACLFGGGGLSLVGVFVVLMDIPFLGISMAHSAFLGAIAGLFFGFSPLAGAIAASALCSILIGPLADRAGATSNVILGALFSATMGLALLLLSLLPGPKSEAMNLIWGSILAISRAGIITLGIVFAAIILLLCLFYKELLAVLFNRELAAASGVPERFFYYGIICVSGLVVSASLDIVGGLLIFSLLINPAGAANQLTYRLKTMFLLSSLFGIASCLAGLLVSCWFDVPTGAVTVLVSSLIYLFAFVFSPKRRRPQMTSMPITESGGVYET